LAKAKDIYIIAQYFMRPREGVKTSQPGWHKQEGSIVWDEKMQVTEGVKNSHKLAQVIINVTKRRVVRNSLSTDGSVPDFWLTWNYFIKHNGKYIKDSMDRVDPTTYSDVVSELEQIAQLANTKATNLET
jgi:hypothetical protein